MSREPDSQAPGPPPPSKRPRIPGTSYPTALERRDSRRSRFQDGACALAPRRRALPAFLPRPRTRAPSACPERAREPVERVGRGGEKARSGEGGLRRQKHELLESGEAWCPGEAWGRWKAPCSSFPGIVAKASERLLSPRIPVWGASWRASHSRQPMASSHQRAGDLLLDLCP